MTGSREKGLDAGMDAYLGKPHTMEELKESISKFLTPSAATARSQIKP
jgi:DNA-binding response OmpR family regulator